MSKKKKTVSFLLAIIMVLSVFGTVPFSAFAVTADTQAAVGVKSGASGDCTWTLNGTELVISGSGAMGEYQSEATPWGYEITKVTIESGVTSIGSSSFSYCTKLADVTIADTVKSIGNSAFLKCTALHQLSIPGSVTRIEDNAFVDSTALGSIDVTDSVVYIGYNALKNTAWYADKADGLVYFGRTAYRYKGVCPASVNIKEGTVMIGDAAFEKCTKLKSVKMPDSVKTIGRWAFSGCSALVSAGLSDSVAVISDKAFSDCTSLTNVAIPDSVQSIRYGAFSGCTSLATITVPGTVIRIGQDAFEDTAWFGHQPDGLVYAGKVAYGMKGTCPASVQIKEGTVSVAVRAFANCEEMTSVKIPASVKIIDDYAFFNCSGLNSLSLPDSVTFLGSYAVCGCSGLKSIAIPGAVTEIHEGTFISCFGLKNVTFSGSVKKIDEGAFKYCKGLTEFVIPATVTQIGTEAFSECPVLMTVTVPASVREIGWHAFGYSGATEYKDGKKIDGFTIRGYKGTAAQTYANENGFVFISLDKLSTPKPSRIQNASSGVSFAWGKVTGAVKYRVFRKSGSGGWAKLIDTTALSIVDKTAKSGTKYAYTVRCISKDGKSYTSDYDKTGKSILCLAQPKITKRGNVAKGTKLTWSKSTGAASYRVYLKSGSSWKQLASVKTNTYTAAKLKSGTTYTYTVRAVSKDGKTLSAYNTTGWKQKFIAAPALPTLKNTKNGVQITVKKVVGAEKYRIFRKTGKGKWVKLTDTTKLTYVDKTAKNGKTYSYTVRCISKDGKAYTSACNTAGKAIKCKR